MTSLPEPYPIPTNLAGQTLAAILRLLMPGKSWSQIRQFIASRRVAIDGSLCLDPARRLKEGEILECLAKARPVYRGTVSGTLVIRHLDEHVVVVEKASGINTVRHPSEREWTDKRRSLSPTLEDLTQLAIAARLRRLKSSLPRLRIVHRLDKETSGLVVFARSVLAERGLGKQFHDHTVIRRYLAVVPGRVAPQTIKTWLVRDRGDGRRGSSPTPGLGKEAITHIQVHEQLEGYTCLSCQLETGRTHQIRIHLAEHGHPVCGERVYCRTVHGEEIVDRSEAPRLALHAAELGFVHPLTGLLTRWEMPLPLDLQGFLERLRRSKASHE